MAVLARGGLVVFPTETLYGLGADAGSAAAVDRLVAARGRDTDKPILVVVRDLAMAETVARVDARAHRLATRFWPGPLTLVLPARPGLPAPLTAGTGTIGVRVPAHPAAAALAAGLGRAVTAPSANPPGAPPPRRLDEARRYFGTAVEAWVDGGELPGGGSTVARLGPAGVEVLRPGPITADALAAALEES